MLCGTECVVYVRGLRVKGEGGGGSCCVQLLGEVLVTATGVVGEYAVFVSSSLRTSCDAVTFRQTNNSSLTPL